jgi:hypothetical protein
MRKFVAAVAAVVFSAPIVADEVESVMLMYQAQEPGVAPYASRILVTGQHVRMDDGQDDGDYLIFNRETRLISSVTHDERTVFEIPPRGVEQEPPMPLQLHSEKVTQGEVPKVAGERPQHHQLYVNDKLCYSVVAVPGLMTDTVEALRDFRQVLAGEHAKVLPRLPADMQDPCDMAINTFHPDWQLRFGLPIQEWDETGNRQMLMDYKQGLMLDEELFGLPEGYRHYDTDEI